VNLLLQRKMQGNVRELHCFNGLVDFASNDYLGLAKSPRLAAALLQEWKKFQTLGSTGSRLLTGNSRYAEALEQRIAHFHGYEAGTLFNSGYMANVGLLSSLSKEQVIFYDASVHASIRVGIRLRGAKAFPFRHNDLAHLEARLKALGPGWIVVESLYSTDGSFAPLPELSELAKRYNASLIVDEAHAVGVFGPEGRGLVAKHRLQGSIFAHVHTFGKALGVSGAIVLGNLALKEVLINFATSFVYTTALPTYVLAAIQCSYDFFPKLEKERAYIHKLIQMAPFSDSQIQPLNCPGNGPVKSLGEKFRKRGFNVRPLMSPTVRRGEEKLRICLHAFNQEEELRNLLYV
jgi:8-amino-7-oxononanoate synthase